MRKGWTETTLGEVTDLIKRGRAPSYTEEDDGVIVLNQKCVRGGCVSREHSRRTDAGIKPIPDWALLRAGDTLINSTGTGTLGRASLVRSVEAPMTADSHITIVRPNPGACFPPFIGTYLNFRESDIESMAGGSTGQTELSREAVTVFPITLPPLVEQRRIVDVIESVDTFIMALETRASTARIARSALLDELLSARISTLRPLREVTLKIGSGATPRGGESSYKESGISLIRSQNVHDYTFLAEGLARIDDMQARLLDNVKVASGDVLINITGASVNRVCIAPDDFLPARVNQHVAILRPNPVHILSRYLMYALRRSDIKSELDTLSGSGTTRQALTKTQLEELEIPITDLQNQQQICDALDSTSAVAHLCDASVRRARDLRSALLSDLLSGDHEIPESYDRFLGAA